MFSRQKGVSYSVAIGEKRGGRQGYVGGFRNFIGFHLNAGAQVGIKTAMIFTATIWLYNRIARSVTLRLCAIFVMRAVWCNEKIIGFLDASFRCTLQSCTELQ